MTSARWTPSSPAGAPPRGRGRVWIAAETLYSMDGDRAPLRDLVALAAPA